MRFSRSNDYSGSGCAVGAVLCRPLAVRFASIALAAVLAASFMPVAALAVEDAPADSDGAQSQPAQAEQIQQGALPGATEESAVSLEPAASEQPVASEQLEVIGPDDSDSQPSAEAPSAIEDDSEAGSSEGEDEELSTLDNGGVGIADKYYTISVGESITLKGLDPLLGDNHQWDFLNTGAATVQAQGKYATITGVVPTNGYIELRHFWGEGSAFFERCWIKVAKASIEDKVTLEVNGVDVIYDNQSHTPKVTATDTGEHDVVVEYSTDNENWSTEIGSASVRNVSDSKTIWVRASVPDYYEGYVVQSAEMKVNPREMTLISGDLQKEYDGEPLVNGLNPVYGKGFVGRDEGASYRFTGSQTEVGESPNSFEYTLNSRTKAENYTINLEFGTLKVIGPDTRPELVVRANSDTFLYNGKEISVDGFEQLSFRIQGETYTVSGLEAYGSGVEPGDYPVEVTGTPVVTDGKGNDVTERFHVKTVNGTLRILDWNGGPSAGSSAASGSSGSFDKPTGSTVGTVRVSGTQASTKPASVSAKTGDGIVLYAVGLAGAAVAAGAVALLARKKRDAGR
ncbi:MAG: hypothetical protein MSA55_03145 [Coriobacteriaceae bacterium]|nr:hypothetical protein [Coriobacteriaceae bacterium]MDD6637062.1 hypothetical protein [Coriobacteriaceae bacterium]